MNIIYKNKYIKFATILSHYYTHTIRRFVDQHTSNFFLFSNILLTLRQQNIQHSYTLHWTIISIYLLVCIRFGVVGYVIWRFELSSSYSIQSQRPCFAGVLAVEQRIFFGDDQCFKCFKSFDIVLEITRLCHCNDFLSCDFSAMLFECVHHDGSRLQMSRQSLW